MEGAKRADAQFLEMIRQNEGIIFKVTSFYTNKEHPISDLYQEVVLNLWKAYPSFRGESKYSTWIYRIALNTCVSFFSPKQEERGICGYLDGYTRSNGQQRADTGTLQVDKPLRENRAGACLTLSRR